MIITNEIQAHAVGRAQARLPQCELVGELRFEGGKLLWPTFYDHQAKELRSVVHYERVAKRGEPYLMTTVKGIPQWHADRIPLAYADLEPHTLWVTFVAKLDPFEPIRLSKANKPDSYRYFVGQQHEIGIDWQHPLFIHPYDRLTKDAVIVRMLQGEVFDTGSIDLMPFYEDESLLLTGRVLRYNSIRETTT